MADLKNVQRTGFPRNYEHREPYVHRTWRGYKKYHSLANPEKMKSDAFEIYKEQSSRLKSTFAKNNKMQSEEGEKALKTIEQLLAGMVKDSVFKSSVESNVFLKEEFRVDEKSFWSYSQSAEKRETLFENDEKNLMEFVTKMGEAIDSFDGLSKETKERIEKEARNQGTKIPSRDMANAMQEVYEDPKADKGIKKLVAANQLLRNYVGLLKPEEAEGVPKIDDKDAREIVRGLAGSLNGLKGGFFEIAVNSLLNNAGYEFLKDLERQGIKITGSEIQGDQKIRTKSLGGKKVTSKTDLNITAQIGDSEASLGLSLKTSEAKKDKNGNLIRKTTIHTGNLGNLIQRANALLEESTYHLANAGIHKSYQDKAYQAAKFKLAAIMAFDALAGLGTKKDTAYFILYQNKVVNMADYLQQIGEQKASTPPFGMTIHGIGGYGTAAKKLKKGDPSVEKYNRSHEAMKLFLGLRTTLTSSTIENP